MSDGSREALEALSDKARRGEPIGLVEAIAVIDYQESLRIERKVDFRRYAMKWTYIVGGAMLFSGAFLVIDVAEMGHQTPMQYLWLDVVTWAVLGAWSGFIVGRRP